jgi:hypothetical protein
MTETMDLWELLMAQSSINSWCIEPTPKAVIDSFRREEGVPYDSWITQPGTHKHDRIQRFSSAEYGRPEGIDRALMDANEWLQRTGIKPLNIETLTKVSGGGLATFSTSDNGVRVWYLTGIEKSPV